MILVMLALIVVGALIGAAGMRRLGSVVRRITGPWRPGAGVCGVIALFAAAGLAARGAVSEALALAALGLVLLVAARQRPSRSRPTAAATPQGLGGPMSEEDARSILGVGPNAGEAEIDGAFRRLMARVHPDVGGAEGLALQLNAARAALIRSKGGAHASA